MMSVFLCLPDITAKYHGIVFALESARFFIWVSLVAYLASPNIEISKLLFDRISRIPVSQTNDQWAVKGQLRT